MTLALRPIPIDLYLFKDTPKPADGLEPATRIFQSIVLKRNWHKNRRMTAGEPSARTRKNIRELSVNLVGKAKFGNDFVADAFVVTEGSVDDDSVFVDEDYIGNTARWIHG
jgi:hypothetical protein